MPEPVVYIKPAFMRVKDAAAYLAVGETEVRRLARAGELDMKFIGKNSSREYRIVTASIDDYIASLPSDPRPQR